MKSARALLPVAVAAVCAGLVLSASASAALYESATHTYPQAWTLSSSGQQLFLLEHGTVEVECAKATISGKLGAASGTLVGEVITYAGCKWATLETVVGTECLYEFGEAGGTNYPFTVSLSIARPTTCGGLIRPKLSGCEVKVPKQAAARPKVEFTSIGGGMEALFSIKGLEYKSSGCALLGLPNNAYTDGEFKGKSTESGVII